MSRRTCEEAIASRRRIGVGDPSGVEWKNDEGMRKVDVCESMDSIAEV
jgi:hypothetical protein